MTESPPLDSAVIVAVGSELLTPHKLDTNSLFLTERLNDLGIVVRYKVVVGDSEQDVGAAVREAMSRADLVVLTGGLGPTDDDVTRYAVADVFGLSLEEDPSVVDAIRDRFALRGLTMPAINARQALIPRGSDVLLNPRGTAPGLWIERGRVVCVLLPGPPRELRPMFETLSTERLRPRTTGRRLFRRVLTVAGRTESRVEELTQPIYSQWRSEEPGISTTILASLGQIELHLTTRDDNAERAESFLAGAVAALAEALGSSLVSTDGARLEEVVGELLKAQQYQVAVAESCTGGLIMSRLTDVPGSSAYVHGGWTVYSDEAKVALGVDPELITRHGAVSEAVASAMAEAACRRAPVEYGLGVTGIAGPGGGSEEKPVGTVCFALAGQDMVTSVRRFRFPGERDRVKFQASQAALDMLRLELLRPD